MITLTVRSILRMTGPRGPVIVPVIEASTPNGQLLLPLRPPTRPQEPPATPVGRKVSRLTPRPSRPPLGAA